MATPPRFQSRDPPPSRPSSLRPIPGHQTVPSVAFEFRPQHNTAQDSSDRAGAPKNTLYNYYYHEAAPGSWPAITITVDAGWAIGVENPIPPRLTCAVTHIEEHTASLGLPHVVLHVPSLRGQDVASVPVEGVGEDVPRGQVSRTGQQP